MTRPNQKTTVLLVEDSDDDAFFFDVALQKSEWPCELIHLVDGSQAVGYLETAGKTATCPDIIFLDLKMPGLSGFEVLEWIATRNFQPRLHVVVLSGSDHQADMVRAREFGANDYLVKPVSCDELKKCLAALSPEAKVRNRPRDLLLTMVQ